MKKPALSAVLAILAGPALAHAGHPAAEELGALHWLTQTDHLTAVSVSLAVAVALGLLRHARRG